VSTADDEARAREAEHLRAVYESLKAAPAPASRRSPRWAWLGAAITALVFLASKFKLIGLLIGVLKLKTVLTMGLSIGVYAFEWGLPFAAGFVFLIFVHEMGHALAMRRAGIPAGAPVFIPFVGAFIAMQGRPRDAEVEARVAMAGPLLGSVGAWIALGLGAMLEHRGLIALGHAAVVLNLVNLVPVPPLDGGRIAGAFTRRYWLIGYAVGVVALVITRSPLLLIVLIVGLFTLVQRFRSPDPAYETVPPLRRRAVALQYTALVGALVLTLVWGPDVTPTPRNPPDPSADLHPATDLA
jgi:Zn-dependent protease